jgi:hypothetical protein
VRKTLVAAVFLLALALSAPVLASVVPQVLQADMKSILEQSDALDFAYVPTYAPPKFQYQTFGGSPSSSHITFSPGAIGDARTLYFTIERYGRNLSACGDGHKQTLHVKRTAVFVRGSVVWRCLRAPSGTVVIVKVHGNGLKPAVLAQVAASAARIR